MRVEQDVAGEFAVDELCGAEVGVVTGRGEVLDPDGQWRGPIRIRIRP